MKNIFIAVGGSGAKVAEALVRMLAVGFPTKFDQNNMPTSAGDDLQIWRLDPDRSSGAAQSLQKAVDEYAFLLDSLSKGDAKSNWGMDIERDAKRQAVVRHLDPLASHEENQRVKTLRGILHSQGRALNGQVAKDASPFLSLFYDSKELDVEIDRGFYQKPFIGAPVMAIFAETLKDANSAGGRQCQLSYLETQSVRFFLCGSLHGGTGACGVPVMSKFIGDHKKAKQSQLDWHLGGCLLAPYCLPPEPPFEQLQEAQRIAKEQDEHGFRNMVDEYLRRYGNVAPFNSLANIQEKRELVRQILLGFYAQRTDMVERARNSLVYYKDYIASYFNALYLIGKPTPDPLAEWSNGGVTQHNPINSAEVSAALAALNFFSGAHDREHKPQTYVIGSSTRTLGDEMFLRDLPEYSLPFNNGLVKVDPEKVFLATATLRHLVTHHIPWAVDAQKWPPELKRLKEYYAAYPDNEDEDKTLYPRALRIITDSISELLSPMKTLGWNGQDYAQLSLLLSDGRNEVEAVTEKIQAPMMSKEAKGSLVLGNSDLRVSKKEFPEWCPPGKEFTRADYLRYVWWHLIHKATANAAKA